MFVYEKRLQYPVKIKTPNPKLAAAIISQYGGPDGELGASLRYLSQRFSMPYPELKGLLTDIGTEELGHLEMIGAIVHQLTRNLTDEQIRTAGFDAYFVDHTTGVYPTAASGAPWSAATMQVTGDMIADLTEDLAAEQKARVTYDNILRLSDDPDVSDAIRFLREREIVHFQRFGEANHTDLSRFYPLWAAAHRGYFQRILYRNTQAQMVVIQRYLLSKHIAMRPIANQRQNQHIIVNTVHQQPIWEYVTLPMPCPISR